MPTKPLSRAANKLRTNVEPLLGSGETLEGAIILERGFKLVHVALASLLLTPIIGGLMMLFGWNRAILVKTNESTRLFRSSSFRSTHPVELIDVLATPVGDALHHGELRVRNQDYRVADGWSNAVSQFRTGDGVPSQPEALPEHGRRLLASNRRTAWAMVAITTLLIGSVLAGGLVLISRPNAFSASLAASQQFCKDSNYGSYLAVNTVAGPVMIAGFDLRSESVWVHRHRSDSYSDLVRGWGGLKDDVDVICVSHDVRSVAATRLCAGSSESAGFTAVRWVGETGEQIRTAQHQTEAVPCFPSDGRDREEVLLDSLLCGVGACRTEV